MELLYYDVDLSDLGYESCTVAGLPILEVMPRLLKV